MGAFKDFIYAEKPLRPVMIRGATNATGDPNLSAVAMVNAAPAGTFYLQDDVLPKPLWRKVGSGTTDWLLLSGGSVTSEDLTYYVRSGGDDTDDGLTVGTALATVEEALSRIPRYILHTMVIDIGQGNFDGFDVSSFTIIFPTGSLEIVGELDNPTLTTGTVSGTATGGSTSTLVDSGQSWTVDELRGMLLLVNGEYRKVRENTSDTINMASRRRR